MRVLIVTSGSMGDVAPYTGLGVRLRDAGHDVTIATHLPFADTVTSTGLGFQPIAGDLRELLSRAHGQDGGRSGTDPRALARLLRLVRPLVRDLGAGIAQAATAGRAEVLLLSSMVAPLGHQVAEAHGIPLAGAFLQPVEATGDFPSPLLGARSLGRWGNRAATGLTQTAVEALYAGPVRTLRDDLGLPREGIRSLRRRQDNGRWPTFHGFSPSVVPRPADWRPGLEIVGYWWPAPRPGWQPPAALADFLAAGPTPVFVGFGSMATGQGERLAATVLTAVRRAGVRAVVQAGWAGLQVHADDVLTVGEVPHHWLFPKVAAVVHHAGAGTAAAGLRAGVPAVVVPVLADQPFWAARLHALGVAPQPVPLPSLTADRLAAALRTVTTDAALRDRAAAMSARVTAEDGAGRVAAWLDNLP
jgi:UDP:flavonoid glycosyltransferase YjiC (YdhE family)